MSDNNKYWILKAHPSVYCWKENVLRPYKMIRWFDEWRAKHPNLTLCKILSGDDRNKNHARNDAEKEVLVQILWNGLVRMVTSLLKQKGTWKEGHKPTLLKRKHKIPNCG